LDRHPTWPRSCSLATPFLDDVDVVTKVPQFLGPKVSLDDRREIKEPTDWLHHKITFERLVYSFLTDVLVSFEYRGRTLYTKSVLSQPRTSDNGVIWFEKSSE